MPSPWCLSPQARAPSPWLSVPEEVQALVLLLRCSCRVTLPFNLEVSLLGVFIGVFLTILPIPPLVSHSNVSRES